MRNEDASQSGLNQGAVDAHNDADHLAARDFGPATGNVITGVGTITGSTGTDMVAAGQGHITAIEGAGGSDTSFSGGKLSVHGQYGTLNIDAHGNYSYVRDPGSPAGVSDTFHYTLANNSGATDVARLVINIGDLPKLATEGTRVVPGSDGVVTLPAGVELSDVHVVGRDLVVTLPDGSTMVIVDGAVFVPQLVLGGVEVPATNLAALLIDSEPHPAAGDLSVAQQQSSGGNFEVPVAPLDPGVPLGDLLPPTELTYTPPEFHDIGQVLEHNDPPFIGTSAINVSEEGLQNGIPDTVGTPDTTNSPTSNGVILVSDPNGNSLTVTMGSPGTSLTSGGVAITWTVSPDGHLVTGSAGANAVITISINDSGAYTVTLLRPVDHPTGGGEQGTDIVIPVSVSDGTDVTTGGTITVTIEDDSPTIAGRFEEPTLVVDETVLATNDTKSFAGAFTVNYGADGPAASNPLAYALGINAGATGLTDTATGSAVVLSLESGVVVGRAGAGGSIVFTVSVDASGNVTLDQQRAVVHNIASSPDTSEGAGLSADNLITLSLVATDRDGDAASTVINIGSNLTFLDDGPSIATTGASEPNLVVDETNLAVDSSTSFAGLFTAGSFGADGAGTKVFTVTTVNGTDSGLVDIATLQHIYLYNNGSGGVVGRVGSGGVADPAGAAAFNVTVDSSGVVTLDQVRAIQHTPDTGPDQASATITDGSINLVATITDKDGDVASASVAIGSNINFHDDAPSIATTGASEPNLVVDETNLAVDSSTSFAGLFTAGSFGADGAGTKVFTVTTVNGTDSGLVDIATLQHIYLYNNGSGGVVGRVGSGGVADPAGAAAFNVTVDSSGVVTLDQVRAIQHTPDTGPDQASATITDGSINLVATITDKDGDVASASVAIGSNINFHDDAPSIATTGASEPNLVVDETNLAVDSSTSFAGLFTAGSFGADGAGTKVFTVTTVNGTDSGLVDIATLQHIYLYNNGSGGVVGRVGSGGVADPAGAAAFNVTVDSSGVVTLDQVRAIQHTPDTGPDQASATITDGSINLVATITDKDGDVASASVAIGSNINFHDDAPSIATTGASEPNLVVDETNLAVDSSTSFAGLFTAGSFGADGAGTKVFTVTTVNGTDSGLVDIATLQHIYLYNNGSGGVVGRVGSGGVADPAGAAAFNVTVDSSGVVTLDQVRAIQHTPDTGPDQASATITDGSINLVATITDKDGDVASASVAIGSNINFHDDAPSIATTGASEPNLVVDETNLAVDSSTSFAGLFTAGSFGADGAGTKVFTVTTVNGTDSGLVDIATLQHIYLYNNGSGGVVGRVGSGGVADPAGAAAFNVTVDSSGVVTLDQVRAIQHTPDTGPDQASATITDGSINLVATITDKDGDVASASVAIGSNINFHDDAPSIATTGASEPNLVVDETNLAVDSSTSFAGLFTAGSFGADGAGTKVFTVTTVNGTDSGLVDIATLQHIYLYNNGSGGVVGRVGSGGVADPAGAAAFNVTVDSSGVVTLDQVRAIQHTPDTGPDQASATITDGSINLVATITDKDGDVASASVAIGSNINFHDDAPSIATTGASEPNLVVDETNLAVDSSTSFAGLFTAGSFGADGAGTKVFTVTTVNGTDSGLVDIATLQHIYLYNNGSGGVVGRVGSGGVADPAGAAAFNVTVDSSGVVTLDQVRAIQHTPDTGPDQASATITDGSINLVATITDKDGDVASASVAIGSNINFHDDAPSIATTGASEPNLVVDETNLAVDSSTSFAGLFTAGSFGADGAGTKVFTVTTVNGTDSGLVDIATLQHIYLYNNGSGGVVGRVGSGGVADPAGAAAFNVTVDSSGVVTLDQVRAIQHTPDTGPDQASATITDGSINLVATITDKDGDVASASVAIGSNINFHDDAPSIATTGASEPNLVVDETNLAVDSSTSFAGLFTAGSFGADGAGTKVFTVTTVNGTDSGLVDIATLQHIYLYNNGSGGVVGRVGSGGVADPAGAAAFNVTVDSSGVVTLDQVRAIQHTPDTGPDQASATITDGSINLVATITDKDGDVASASVAIGSNINFHDDAPSIATTGASEPNLVVDETNLALNSSTSFAGLFTAGSFGADGAGTKVFTVTTVNGTDSGLVDIATLQHIYLYNNGSGGVVGRVGSGGVADPAGAAAFNVTVDSSGVVTLDQVRAIQHTPDTGPDQASATITDGSINLVATITDKDGDVASASVAIGSNINFHDDAPSIATTGASEPNLVVDETNLAVDSSTSFAGLFTAGSFGADGAGTKVFTVTTVNGTDLGLVDIATLQHIYLYNNGSGGVVGRVGSGGVADPAGAAAFNVTVDSSGVVTLDQVRAIQHTPDTGPDQASATITDGSINLVATITDKDGDVASASVAIGSNINFHDDAPSIATTGASEPNLVVDETNLAVDSSTSFAGLFTAGSFGADGAGTKVFTVTTVNGTDLGLVDIATLQHIYLYNNGSGGVVGRVGSGGVADPAGAAAFNVTVDSSGVVTLDQVRAIQHTPDTGPDQASATITDGSINLVATITDKDGDVASASVAIGSNINFHDDAPSIATTGASEPNLVVDETNLAVDSSTSFAGLFTAGSFGADGAGTKVFTVTTVNGTDSGLVDIATLQHIYLYNNGSGGVVGRVGSGGVADPAGAAAFNVTVDSSGVVTLDQVRAIQHTPDTGPDQASATITDGSINLVATITDKDGDVASASVAIGSNINFHDDAPSIATTGASEPNLVVDETNLALNSSTSFAGLFTAGSFGADGAGTKVFTVTTVNGTDSGLVDIATLQHIYLYNNGSGGVVGRVGSGGVADPAGAAAFNVTVDSSGVVTLDQVRAIQHTPDTGPDQASATITDGSINLVATITDKDGDVASASVAIGSNINFHDDAPSIATTGASEPNLVVDETNLALNSSTSFAGLFTAGSFGADGAGTKVFTVTTVNGTDSGLVDIATLQHIYLYNNGSGGVVGRVGSGGVADPAGAAAFNVTVDSSGVVTLDQVRAIQHTPDTGPDQASATITDGSINLVATITDKDGDVASASVAIGSNINFHDDAPSALHAAAITSGLSNGGGDTASANLDGGVGGNSIVSDNFGADGAGKAIFTAATITALQGQSLTHNAAPLSYVISPDGQTLTGYVDTNTNSIVDGGETIFTIQLQPVGQPNDYVVTMVQSVDTVQNIDFNGGGYNFVGGNGSWAGFTSGTNGDGILDLLLTPMVNGANSSTMNTNANEGGVGSGNSVALGEGVRVDTVQDLQAVPAPTPSGDYGLLANENHVFGQHENVLGISALISTVGGNSTQTTDIQLVARDEAGASDTNDLVGDGAIEAITKVVLSHGASTVTVLKTGGAVQVVSVDGHNVTVTFGATDATVASVLEGTRIGGFTADGFDSLEFRNVGGQDFKIGDFNTLSVTNGPLDVSVPISIVDKDGDAVSSGSLAIHIDGSAPPVVLDLNGDGVHFLGQDAGVHYDYGAGLVATAWAAADDGILIRDANHNGTVDNASEFVFGSNGQTDMEALHAQYGAQLDANDADFTMFAVWNDANSNGVVDVNEVQSLAEAGITSISLVSDGHGYSAANGEVAVAGTAIFTRADGSTGAAADASFATGSRITTLDERVAANSNNVVLAAAIAAAGFAASTPAAASVVGDAAPANHITNTVVSVAPVDMSILHLSTETAMPALMGEVREAFAVPQIAAHTAFSSEFAAGSTGDLMMGHAQMVAPTALLAGSDMAAGQIAIPMMASNVAMPSADAMMAMAGLTHAQSTVTVDRIVAEALHGGGGGPDINALLNALPTQGNGGNVGTEFVASLGNVSVPTWDTGHGAAFTFAATNAITTEAMVLHHDAIQPVANG